RSYQICTKRKIMEKNRTSQEYRNSISNGFQIADIYLNRSNLDAFLSAPIIPANQINLHWLGARIVTNGTKNFEDAQKRVNALIELNPNNAIGHSEQVYLHLRKGGEQLAF